MRTKKLLHKLVAVVLAATIALGYAEPLSALAASGNAITDSGHANPPADYKGTINVNQHLSTGLVLSYASYSYNTLTYFNGDSELLTKWRLLTNNFDIKPFDINSSWKEESFRWSSSLISNTKTTETKRDIIFTSHHPKNYGIPTSTKSYTNGWSMSEVFVLPNSVNYGVNHNDVKSWKSKVSVPSYDYAYSADDIIGLFSVWAYGQNYASSTKLYDDIHDFRHSSISTDELPKFAGIVCAYAQVIETIQNLNQGTHEKGDENFVKIMYRIAENIRGGSTIAPVHYDVTSVLDVLSHEYPRAAKELGIELEDARFCTIEFKNVAMEINENTSWEIYSHQDLLGFHGPFASYSQLYDLHNTYYDVNTRGYTSASNGRVSGRFTGWTTISPEDALDKRVTTILWPNKIVKWDTKLSDYYLFTPASEPLKRIWNTAFVNSVNVTPEDISSLYSTDVFLGWSQEDLSTRNHEVLSQIWDNCLGHDASNPGGFAGNYYGVGYWNLSIASISDFKIGFLSVKESEDDDSEPYVYDEEGTKSMKESSDLSLDDCLTYAPNTWSYSNAEDTAPYWKTLDTALQQGDHLQIQYNKEGSLGGYTLIGFAYFDCSDSEFNINDLSDGDNIGDLENIVKVEFLEEDYNPREITRHIDLEDVGESNYKYVVSDLYFDSITEANRLYMLALYKKAEEKITVTFDYTGGDNYDAPEDYTFKIGDRSEEGTLLPKFDTDEDGKQKDEAPYTRTYMSGQKYTEGVDVETLEPYEDGEFENLPVGLVYKNGVLQDKTNLQVQFIGWTTEENWPNKDYELVDLNSDQVLDKEEYTLYAVYGPPKAVTVKFDAQGGTLIPSTTTNLQDRTYLVGQDYTEGWNKTNQEVIDYGKLPEVEKDGMPLAGWAKEKDNKNTIVSTSDKVLEDHTLYAIYDSEARYPVEFFVGASPKGQSADLQDGNPESGLLFVYFYMDPDNIDKLKSLSSVPENGNYTITASLSYGATYSGKGKKETGATITNAFYTSSDGTVTYDANKVTLKFTSKSAFLSALTGSESQSLCIALSIPDDKSNSAKYTGADVTVQVNSSASAVNGTGIACDPKFNNSFVTDYGKTGNKGYNCVYFVPLPDKLQDIFWEMHSDDYPKAYAEVLANCAGFRGNLTESGIQYFNGNNGTSSTPTDYSYARSWNVLQGVPSTENLSIVSGGTTVIIDANGFYRFIGSASIADSAANAGMTVEEYGKKNNYILDTNESSDSYNAGQVKAVSKPGAKRTITFKVNISDSWGPTNQRCQLSCPGHTFTTCSGHQSGVASASASCCGSQTVSIGPCPYCGREVTATADATGNHIDAVMGTDEEGNEYEVSPARHGGGASASDQCVHGGSITFYCDTGTWVPSGDTTIVSQEIFKPWENGSQDQRYTGTVNWECSHSLAKSSGTHQVMETSLIDEGYTTGYGCVHSNEWNMLHKKSQSYTFNIVESVDCYSYREIIGLDLYALMSTEIVDIDTSIISNTAIGQSSSNADLYATMWRGAGDYIGNASDGYNGRIIWEQFAYPTFKDSSAGWKSTSINSNNGVAGYYLGDCTITINLVADSQAPLWDSSWRSWEMFEGSTVKNSSNKGYGSRWDYTGGASINRYSSTQNLNIITNNGQGPKFTGTAGSDSNGYLGGGGDYSKFNGNNTKGNQHWFDNDTSSSNGGYSNDTTYQGSAGATGDVLPGDSGKRMAMTVVNCYMAVNGFITDSKEEFQANVISDNLYLGSESPLSDAYQNVFAEVVAVGDGARMFSVPFSGISGDTIYTNCINDYTSNELMNNWTSNMYSQSDIMTKSGDNYILDTSKILRSGYQGAIGEQSFEARYGSSNGRSEDECLGKALSFLSTAGGGTSENILWLENLYSNEECAGSEYEASRRRSGCAFIKGRTVVDVGGAQTPTNVRSLQCTDDSVFSGMSNVLGDSGNNWGITSWGIKTYAAGTSGVPTYNGAELLPTKFSGYYDDYDFSNYHGKYVIVALTNDKIDNNTEARSVTNNGTNNVSLPMQYASGDTSDDVWLFSPLVINNIDMVDTAPNGVYSDAIKVNNVYSQMSKLRVPSSHLGGNSDSTSDLRSSDATKCKNSADTYLTKRDKADGVLDDAVSIKCQHSDTYVNKKGQSGTVSDILIHNPLSIQYVQVIPANHGSYASDVLDESGQDMRSIYDGVDEENKNSYLMLDSYFHLWWSDFGDFYEDEGSWATDAWSGSLGASNGELSSDTETGVRNEVTGDGLTYGISSGYSNQMNTSRWVDKRTVTFDFPVSYVSITGVEVYVPSNTEIDLSNVQCSLATRDGYGYVTYPDTSVNNENDYDYIIDQKLGLSDGVGNVFQYGTSSLQDFWDKDSEYHWGLDYQFYIPSSSLERTNATIGYTVYGINGNSTSIEYIELNNMRYDGKASESIYSYDTIELVGRIGNLSIQDTADIRFSNLFKQVESTESWLIEGVIRPTNSAVSNVIFTTENNILLDKVVDNVVDRVHEAPNHAVQSITAILGTDYDGTTSYNHNKADEFHSLPLTSAFNAEYTGVGNATEFSKEQLHMGYNVFMDIETIGNYYGVNTKFASEYIYEDGERVGEMYVTQNDYGPTAATNEADGDNRSKVMTIVPKYVLYDYVTGEFVDVDIYHGSRGAYQLLWDCDGSAINTSVASIYINLEEEGDRRGVSEVEEIVTQKTLTGLSSGMLYTVSAFEGEDYIGTASKIVLDQFDRTFIGSPLKYGALYSKDNSVFFDDAVIGDFQLGTRYEDEFLKGQGKTELSASLDGRVSDLAFAMQSQRYHFSINLPSSSYLTYPNVGVGQLDIERSHAKLMEEHPYAVLLCMADINVAGDIWSLHYDFKRANNVEASDTITLFKAGQAPDDYMELSGNRDNDVLLPYSKVWTKFGTYMAPICVFDPYETSTHDLDTFGTH